MPKSIERMEKKIIKNVWRVTCSRSFWCVMNIKHLVMLMSIEYLAFSAGSDAIYKYEINRNIL